MDIKEFDVELLLTKQEAKDLLGTTVPDIEPNVTEPGVYRDKDTGEPILVYLPYPGDTSELRNAVLNTGMSTTLRGSGMRNQSRTFGMAARSVVLKRESCRPASLAWDNPAAQITLSNAALSLGAKLKEILPEVFEHDTEVLEQVLPEWRMAEDSLWTSGVINQSSQLPYHRDRANFETWSAMPVVRRGMKGGHLSFPEYGITVNCRDGYALWFNGNRYVHGVTPMTPTAPDGYRYSIVFYALRGMKDCHTYAVEVGESRKRRTERELKMGETDTAVLAQRISGRSTGSFKVEKQEK